MTANSHWRLVCVCVCVFVCVCVCLCVCVCVCVCVFCVDEVVGVGVAWWVGGCVFAIMSAEQKAEM